ncbi:PepSY-like domain-containing protein [Xanthocytophaga flava]|uniref:PepSY-like domain-containing protein n=1 Tax=Xanthocytophaga flava TaxID=3048013 RepID=UPI0028D3CE9E|nr:PepSY-like domain-containing protein [Xanthocytophaga flavus]MDJ1470317.1 PepSY-like domain-containing protein [Xanthocytophaga flavus]
MKQFICLMLGVFASGIWAEAQTEAKSKKEQPPVAVINAFQKAFPQSQKVKWEKEKKDEYEASFLQNGKEMSVVYTTQADLLETEVGITASELPESVQKYVKQHYTGKTIKETAKITKTGGQVFYEVEIDKKDLMFDADGNFLKVEP